MREEHYASLEERKFKTIAQARAQAPKTDWVGREPCKPTFIGKRQVRYLQQCVCALIDQGLRREFK